MQENLPKEEESTKEEGTKEPPVPKKKSKTALIVVVIILGIFFALGLAGVFAYRYAINRAKDVIERVETGDFDRPPGHGERVEEEILTWPSGTIPKDFPEYTDGELISVPNLYLKQGPYFVEIKNTSERAIESYISELEGLGFVLVEKGVAYADEDTSWTLEKKVNGQNLIVLLSFSQEHYDGSKNYLKITYAEGY